MDFTITRADIDDIPQLLQLVNSAYRGESAKKGWTHEASLIEGTLRADADMLRKMIQDPESTLLKYVSGGEIIGTVYLEKRNDHLYLGLLSVHPELQARGIGKELLLAAEQHARQSGCTSIIMTVISVREELIKWYNRHGYTATGATLPFPDDNRYGTPVQPLEFVVLEKKML